MKQVTKFRREQAWDAAWIAGLFLTLALCLAVPRHSFVPKRGSRRADAKSSLPTRHGAAVQASRNHSEVRNYFLDFAGDHSLDVATVIEQPAAGYTKYTVQLRLASGAEQSLVVSAPPGGLQVEMHDMTGDKVANDIVLRPALVRWLPTVLVNDGHEHFEVAVSGPDPSSFSSSEDLGSRPREAQTFALLTSSGFEAVQLLTGPRFLNPHLQQSFLLSITQTATGRLSRESSPGRAPPIEKAI